MSIMVNSGSHVSRVMYGNSRIVSVWEGNQLKFPNGLLRNNNTSTGYTNKDGICQLGFKASESGVQMGSSAHVSTYQAPSYYNNFRVFQVNSSSYYYFRYKTTLYNTMSPGSVISLRIAKLIYNTITGIYDNNQIIASSDDITILYGETKTIDWGDGLYVPMTPYNLYCFCLSVNARGCIESNASASLIYRG